MTAAVLTAIHQPLAILDFPQPDVPEGYALVEIHHAALNHRDYWITIGQYAGIKTPIILGSDGAGIVTQINAPDQSFLHQPVLINPGMNWGDSPKAQSKAFHILGLPSDGTLAQYVAVPLQNIYPIPKHMTTVEASALPLAGLTAFRACFSRANIQSGEKVLITGIGGGVALFALQMVVAVGAEVWVTSSSPEKIEKAITLGAKGGILYTEPDWDKQILSATGGIDAVVDGSGGASFAKYVDVCSSGGRIVMYGGTAGKLSEVPPSKIFWKQLTVMGSTMGSPQDFNQMLGLISHHQIQPVISAVYPLTAINEALALMGAGKQTGKIVIQVK
jgi:NADPH:quinone reductase-like Zn-dependent oxidoreductase